jgi:hypothetical protein
MLSKAWMRAPGQPAEMRLAINGLIPKGCGQYRNHPRRFSRVFEFFGIIHICQLLKTW